jgi:hypothetical protein
MRALILLGNLVVLALAYWLGSFTGLLIGIGVCMVLVVAAFGLSMARAEARESKAIKRAMGRNTTLMGKLD